MSRDACDRRTKVVGDIDDKLVSSLFRLFGPGTFLFQGRSCLLKTQLTVAHAEHNARKLTCQEGEAVEQVQREDAGAKPQQRQQQEMLYLLWPVRRPSKQKEKRKKGGDKKSQHKRYRYHGYSQYYEQKGQAKAEQAEGEFCQQIGETFPGH